MGLSIGAVVQVKEVDVWRVVDVPLDMERNYALYCFLFNAREAVGVEPMRWPWATTRWTWCRGFPDDAGVKIGEIDYMGGGGEAWLGQGPSSYSPDAISLGDQCFSWLSLQDIRDAYVESWKITARPDVATRLAQWLCELEKLDGEVRVLFGGSS